VLGESDLMEFISQCSELRCERYWLLSGFCCWKFKQIAKIELGRKRKTQLSPQCVHIRANGTGYTRFNRVYFSIFRAKVWKIFFWLSGFCCWKFKQIAKIELGRKTQLSPQCVHIRANGTGYTNLIEFISQFSELRCERCFFYWVDFVARNSNKLQKLGLEGKISWALIVFTILDLEFSIMKMWKIKNVFTLGPTAQATLWKPSGPTFGGMFMRQYREVVN
jgi:hypothetical protein